MVHYLLRKMLPKIVRLPGQTIFVGTITTILLMRFLFFVQQNSVNTLFWDQWDFLGPLFTSKNDLWTMFSLQHGPHRQGLGGIMLKLIYPWSGWNTSLEVFISALIVTTACYVTFFTKKKAFGKLSWTDIVIPLTFFTLLQYENYVGTPNPAHGPIPTLLVATISYCLLVENTFVRALSLPILTFFTTYTGFAIFSGIPIIFLLITQIWKSQAKSERLIYGLSASLCVLSFAAFLVGYTKQPAVDCFKFPHDQPLQYLEFVILLFGRAAGMLPNPSSSINLLSPSFILAAILFSALTLTAIFSFVKLLRLQDRQTELIFYLASFTLIFAAFTAVGRVCLGTSASLSSRYVPYSTPGILALYFSCIKLFSLESFYRRLSSGLLIALILLLCVKEVDLADSDRASVNWYRTGKIRWTECYLREYDAAACDKVANFRVYPHSSQIKEKLEYLRVNNLNFFRFRERM